MHSSVTFKISHLGLSWVHGRFDDVAGNFTIDPNDPGKDSFDLTIKAQSVDTNNQKRDEHLRSPDFFNVKQFPLLTFKSTAVKATDSGLEVTGDVTMHGVTKPVTFPLVGGRTAGSPRRAPHRLHHGVRSRAAISAWTRCWTPLATTSTSQSVLRGRRNEW